MQAAEAALESSEEENGGESPPPHKKAGLASVSKTSALLSRASTLVSEGSVMHDEVRVTQSGGDNGTVSNTNGELSYNKLIGNGGGDETLEEASAVLKRKLSRFDEDVVRLIGQHLQSLGLQLVFNYLCFVTLKALHLRGKNNKRKINNKSLVLHQN